MGSGSGHTEALRDLRDRQLALKLEHGSRAQSMIDAGDRVRWRGLERLVSSQTITPVLLCRILVAPVRK
jgi:hypothetical protein